MNTGYFKTGKRLQVAIDNQERIEGMTDFLDAHFMYTFDLDYGSTPTWEGAFNGELFDPCYWMLEGCIDYGINGTIEYEADDVLCQYRNTIYCSENQGDIVTINGIKLMFMTTISAPTEQEHQAEDGGLAYDYRGEGYIAIFKRV